MPDKLKNCPQCGKLFAPEPPEVLCEDCALDNDQAIALVDHAIEQEGLLVPSQIAASTGLTVARVKKILASSTSRAHDTRPESLCTRCEKRPAQKTSEYCLQCRIEVFSALRDSADHVLQDIELGPPEPDTIRNRLSIGDTISDKRRRTGTYRFDPSPKFRKRYGG